MKTEQWKWIIPESLSAQKYENGTMEVRYKGEFVTREVFSSDTLPRYFISYPSAYIRNTDRSNLPGQHWVVFLFQNAYFAEIYYEYLLCLHFIVRFCVLK